MTKAKNEASVVRGKAGRAPDWFCVVWIKATPAGKFLMFEDCIRRGEWKHCTFLTPNHCQLAGLPVAKTERQFLAREAKTGRRNRVVVPVAKVMEWFDVPPDEFAEPSRYTRIKPLPA